MVIPREVTRMISPINNQGLNDPLFLSYLAGFIDGDGCINGQIVKTTYGRKFKLKLSIVIYQLNSRR